MPKKPQTDMTPTLLKRWLRALRSGRWKQGSGRLRRGNQHGRHYCCLGVLDELAGRPSANSAKLMRDREQHIPVLVDADFQDQLVTLNDTQGLSFEEIADYIEGHGVVRSDGLLGE